MILQDVLAKSMTTRNKIIPAARFFAKLDNRLAKKFGRSKLKQAFKT